MAENVLYYGDNLDILRRYIKDESVDLIYLDPPFKSNQDYNVLFAEKDGTQAAAQIKAFEDTWHWDMSAAEAYDDVMRQGGKVAQAMIAFRTFLGENDMLAYLAMMAPRLVEMRRALKPTGSIYLHCDPTASHYLKMLMDSIFGPQNFRNEVIWRRTGSHNSPKRYGPIHDVILFYSKSSQYYFRPTFQPYMKGHVDGYFKKSDEKGRYWTNSLTGAGTRNGESGSPWHGYNPTAVGRHWAVPGKIAEELGLSDDMTVQQKLDALDTAGFIDHSDNPSVMPTCRQYLKGSPGLMLQDIWAYQPHTRGTLYVNDAGIDEDVRWLVKQGDLERLGYPTQKPTGLLNRIIESSCPPDGIILDPFCGCGTTVAAAELKKLRWVGIDITHLAVNLIRRRLRDAFGAGILKTFKVIGEPVSMEDARELADADPYQFQWWALGLVGARPAEGKKGADKGIDGRIYFHDDPKGATKQIVISVKAGKLQAAYVRDIRGVMDREKAEISVLISMDEPTKQMRTEAATAGFYESPYGKRYPRLQLLTVGELLAGKDIDYPPSSHKQDVTYKHAPKVKGHKEDAPQLPFGKIND
jgi:DNA modification methylase